MNLDDCVFPLQVYFIEPIARNSYTSTKSLVYFYLTDTMSHITDYISLSAGFSETL